MKKTVDYLIKMFVTILVLVMVNSSVLSVPFAMGREIIEKTTIENAQYADDFANTKIDEATVVNPHYYAAGPDEAVKKYAVIVRDKMVARNKNFTVNIESARQDYSNLITEIFNMAISNELAELPVHGDYLAYQYKSYSYGGSAEVKGNTYLYKITFDVDYYTTAAQETEVTNAIKNALSKINTEGKTDYDKIRAVYDYICGVCTYSTDLSAKNNNNFSAYGAVIKHSAVCQGFSVLLYRMLEEVGVDSRIITNSTHAWNIAKLGDKYYNLDVTWDDSCYERKIPYKYFLKCDIHFDDHTRGAAFASTSFKKAYPMTEDCYGKTAKAAEVTSLAAGSVKEAKGLISGFILKWNKVKDATNYQIQYSTDKSFKNAKSVNAGDFSTKTIDNLKDNTKYYVRVRGYNTARCKVVYGAWSGTKEVTTKKKPAKTSFASVSAQKKGFTAKWKKVADCTGYELQYSTSNKFTNAKTVKVAKNSTLTKKVTGLKATTKYYVRVRSYKTVDGIKYYSEWSAVKNIKTK